MYRRPSFRLWSSAASLEYVSRPISRCPRRMLSSYKSPVRRSSGPIFELPGINTGQKRMSTAPTPLKGINRSPRTGDPDRDSKLDLGLKIMEHDMKSPEFRDPVWGFVIYRCIEGNDVAWRSFLERLRSQISQQLRDEELTQPRLDLLPFHHLHVIDDPKFYGAPINKTRAHFTTWLL